MKKGIKLNKIMCAILAAGAPLMCYSSASLATTLNGHQIDDHVITNQVVADSESAKLVVGQGNLDVQTSASIGNMMQNFVNNKDKGFITALRAALGPSGNSTPLAGVIGGEGKFDARTNKAFDVIHGLLKPKTSQKKENSSVEKYANLISKIQSLSTANNGNNEVFNQDVSVNIGGNKSEPVILGFTGGDLAINANIDDLKIFGNTPSGEDHKPAWPASIEKITTVRNGDINININSGNVLVGIGASSAVGIGNISVDAKIANKIPLLSFDTKGAASTTINGNVNTNVGPTANIGAFANGGAAVAIGGDTTSTVNGNTSLNIDSKVNFGKLEGLTVAAVGGGLSVSTLGANANSTVNGTSSVNINNGLALGVGGAGVAAAIDATIPGSLIAGHQVGNNAGHSDVDINKGPINATINFEKVNQGGTATSTTGDTNINLTGTTTALGVVGGGVATSLHKYVKRPKDVGGAEGDIKPEKDGSIGSSNAIANAGHTTINVNVAKADGKPLTPEEKAEIIKAISNMPTINNPNDLIAGLQGVVKGLQDKGVVLGVTGGGLAVAYTDAGAKATTNTKGSDINLNSGYVVGAFGGGIALANREASAEANTDGKINVNVNGAEVIGLFANGGAGHRESSSMGSASVNATDTEVNVNAGSVDGLFGGGLAVRTGTNKDDTSTVKTSGTSTLNIAGNVNKLNYAEAQGIFDKVGFGDAYKAVASLAKDAAIVGGGVASGKGAVSYVENSVINIEDGADIKGDVFAGGISASEGKSEVKNSVVNYKGGTVDGQLNGQGLGDNAVVGNSTLNYTASTLTSLADKAKIAGFNNVSFNAAVALKDVKAGNTVALIDGTLKDGKFGTINTNGNRLDLNSLEGTGKYFFAQNYDKANSSLWTDSNLAYDRTEYFAKTEQTEAANGEFNVIYKDLASLNETEKDQAVDSFVDSLGPNGSQVHGIISGVIAGQGTLEGAKDFFGDLSSSANPDNGALTRGMLLGEASGVTSTAIAVANDMAKNSFLRLSFTQDVVNGSPIDTEGAVWAKYIHNSHDLDGVSSSLGDLSSNNDYDGITVGFDLPKLGNFQSGIAFSYVEGDGDGLGVNNDFDMWGVNLYSNLLVNDNYNFIGDLGYTRGRNDLTSFANGKSLSADRDLDIYSAGLRAERLFVNGNTQIVPFASVRYMNINGSDYTTYYNDKAAFNNSVDSQNIWTLPVGVSLRNETITDNGWRLTPKAELSYIYAFGDTDNDLVVNAGSGASSFSYDVMDKSSYLGAVSMEVAKGAFSLGAGYSFQKGSDTEDSKLFVNANYSF